MMTLKKIGEQIFKVEPDTLVVYYSRQNARKLYDIGVSYKRLALCKWLGVRNYKKEGKVVHKICSMCGYCFEYGMCLDCPLQQLECCDLINKLTSCNMTWLDIDKIIECIEASNKALTNI
jgi:hypothetical protein